VGKGVFIIDTKKGDNPPDIRPDPKVDAIPEDQAKLQHRLYATYRVLRAIEEWRPFVLGKKKGPTAAKEVFQGFRDRLMQVAGCGLTGDNPKTAHASGALEQIREEIGIRMGRVLKFRYLAALAAWGFAGALVGVALVLLGQVVSDLSGYGWVVIGAMVGAWMSIASTRRSVDLDELPDLLGRTLEPIVRLLYVGLVAVVIALLLEREVITIMLGKANLKAFAGDIGLALLVGVVSGLAERTMSNRVIKLAQGSTAES